MYIYIYILRCAKALRAAQRCAKALRCARQAVRGLLMSALEGVVEPKEWSTNR